MENSSALNDVCECFAQQAPLQRVRHSVVYERNVQAKEVLHTIICEATYTVSNAETLFSLVMGRLSHMQPMLLHLVPTSRGQGSVLATNGPVYLLTCKTPNLLTAHE